MQEIRPVVLRVDEPESQRAGRPRSRSGVQRVQQALWTRQPQPTGAESSAAWDRSGG